MVTHDRSLASGGCGKGRDELAERRADRVVGIGGGVVAVEDRHDQAEHVARFECERGRLGGSTDSVAAVTTAGGVDRDADRSQRGDVAAHRTVGDLEAFGQFGGADARSGLQESQHAQGVGDGDARRRCHHPSVFRI